MKILFIVLYLTAIVLANVLTASNPPIFWGNLIIPAGSFLIGATFILRDLVQNAIGRKATYATIASAMAVSAVSSYALGDTLWITAASAITFLCSETADTEVYSRLRLPMAWRVLYSGLVGGVLDSALFVLIGLSPLGAGFLSWDLVGYAIAGQIMVKLAMQCLGALAIHFVPKSGSATKA